MKLNIEGYNDITWQQYKDYFAFVQKLTPEDRTNLSNDEMSEIMLCGAIQSGWVQGMKPEAESPEIALHELRRELGLMPVREVTSLLNKFLDFYVSLRSTDPN